MEGSNLEREVWRLRDRVHKLEATHSAIGLLGKQVGELTEQMPALARRAAREAVDESIRRRHADTFANLRTYAAILAAGVALGSLIVYVVLR